MSIRAKLPNYEGGINQNCRQKISSLNAINHNKNLCNITYDIHHIDFILIN